MLTMTISTSEYEALLDRLEAAESRIKASQEQEPFGFVICDKELDILDISKDRESFFSDEDLQEGELNIIAVFKEQVIPPDVAKLQRKIDRAYAVQQDAEQRELDCCHDLDAAVAENAELTQKLAEQQVHLNSALEQLQCACSYEEPQHVCEYHRKLLAEAKRQGANEVIGNYMPDFSDITQQPGGSNE